MCSIKYGHEVQIVSFCICTRGATPSKITTEHPAPVRYSVRIFTNVCNLVYNWRFQNVDSIQCLRLYYNVQFEQKRNQIRNNRKSSASRTISYYSLFSLCYIFRRFSPFNTLLQKSIAFEGWKTRVAFTDKPRRQSHL